MSARCRTSLSILAVLVILTGCGVSRPVATPEPPLVVVDDAEPEGAEAAHLVRRSRLLNAVAEWRGTPYRYGGNSPRGIDCSGFTSRIFAEVFDVRIPRTTRAQRNIGIPVERSELMTGDLVFFRTPARTDHVGVYIGEGEFAHSSSSSGVMISHLDEQYWADSYRQSRRVLRPIQQPPDATPTEENKGTAVQVPPERAGLTHAARPTRRVGW